MNHSNLALLVGTALFALSAAAVAQVVPAKDFARHADIQSVTLSPGGDYIALAVPTENDLETQLQVVKLDGQGDTQILRFGNQQHVSDVLWSDDTQLVVSRAEMQPLLALPSSYGELMSSDVTGKTQQTLFAFLPERAGKRGRRKDQGFASVAKVLDAEPGKVLVYFSCWPSVCGQKPPTTIYKVDTRTGEREQVDYVNEPASFDFDQAGRARILTTSDDADEPVLKYRPGADNAWQPMPKSLAGRSVGSTWFAPDANTVYATLSDHGEPSQLYKLDLAAGTRVKLAGRDDVEIANLMYEGHHGKPFAVVYDADKPQVQYLDANSEWAKLHAGLLKAFPGQMVSILDASRDGSKVLLTAWSDRQPANYYLFNRASGKLLLVAESMPWIDAKQMASTRPIAFKSRDGQTQLFGFLTSKGQGPQPLVVMPHGGPHGPYDQWGFDPQVQFLANRGYAVLQVNYRGSGGRGHEFETAGYRQWGGKIQDDIADGVQWAIDNKLADPARVCTFGASFGGYAALMQPIRFPDMYKCAVGYVGVYDLAVMKTCGDIPGTRQGRRYLSRVIGDDDAVLAANSPAQLASKVKVPVLLVAGKDDKRVPMDQFNAQARAFRGSGSEIETLVVDGEGHGFYKPEHRVKLYDKLEAFLGKYIGPGSR
ncbi:MAG: prolyl oligopeptidase family serine peptidase [Luteimonas sp.]